MKISISNNLLDNFNLKNHEYLTDKKYYDLESGKQEYRLYSYLSTLFNNCRILDIGTLDGRSAVALSHNDTNKVISYNILDQIKNDYHPIYSKSNIEFRIKNVLDDLTPEFVSKLKIVMIDIDHFGKIESLIMNKLYKMGFSGIIILDDIHHPQPKEKLLMENLWRNINLKKYDVTKYGHFSGTGIVIMNSNIDLELF
jgi:hypothetical protein